MRTHQPALEACIVNTVLLIMRRWARAASVTMALASFAFASTKVAAEQARGVRPAVDSVLALRGGTIMLPLVAQRPGDQWPRSMAIQMADGRRFEGPVAWISVDDGTGGGSGGGRSWTMDERRLAIRAISRDDDTSQDYNAASGGGPYLVARVPVDGSGDLRIDGRVIATRWIDVPWNDPLRRTDAMPLEQRMPVESAPDRPDDRSPFEYWRWVLLADRLGLQPPEPWFGEGDVRDDPARLAAEHYALLWRVGLARIGRLSQRVARECRSMLTRTAVDRARTVATWVADPREVATLLGVLTDFSRSDERALADVVEWLEQQPPVMFWPENQSGDAVRLAVTPLRDDAMSVRVGWAGAPSTWSTVQLEPGVIARLTIERLPLISSGPAGDGRLLEPALQILRLEADRWHVDLRFGPRVVEARPPGVFFRPLSPALTLLDAQLQRAPLASPDQATVVQVRRISGRWEVYIECARLVERRGGAMQRESIRSLDDLRGHECVALLLGDDHADDETTWLILPEHDWPIALHVRGDRVIGPATGGENLQVHKRSYGDRWTCRVVLPEAWFSLEKSNPAFIGFVRGHGDSRALETGPAPSPDWRSAPGRVAIDLSHWDDLPAGE